MKAPNVVPNDGRSLDVDRAAQVADHLAGFLMTSALGPAEAWLAASLAAKFIDRVANDQAPAAWADERKRLEAILESASLHPVNEDGEN